MDEDEDDGGGGGGGGCVGAGRFLLLGFVAMMFN